MSEWLNANTICFLPIPSKPSPRRKKKYYWKKRRSPVSCSSSWRLLTVIPLHCSGTCRDEKSRENCKEKDACDGGEALNSKYIVAWEYAYVL